MTTLRNRFEQAAALALSIASAVVIGSGTLMMCV
jgi:hypothetical protein